MPQNHIKSLDRRNDRDQNLACGLRVLMIAAGSIFLASMLDISPFLSLLTTLLVMASIIRGVSAAKAQEPYWGTTLNRWDEAAMLLGLGLGISLISGAAAV